MLHQSVGGIGAVLENGIIIDSRVGLCAGLLHEGVGVNVVDRFGLLGVIYVHLHVTDAVAVIDRATAEDDGDGIALLHFNPLKGDVLDILLGRHDPGGVLLCRCIPVYKGSIICRENGGIVLDNGIGVENARVVEFYVINGQVQRTALFGGVGHVGAIAQCIFA